MSTSPSVPAFPRRPACAVSAFSRKRASSAATTPISMPNPLGYTVQVFAFVGLTSQAEADLQQFEEMVSAWPQVRECHMLMGETDFLLKIAAHDWDDFQKFLTSRLTPAPNVSHVKTALAIRSAKNMPAFPSTRSRVRGNLT